MVLIVEPDTTSRYQYNTANIPPTKPAVATEITETTATNTPSQTETPIPTEPPIPSPTDNPQVDIKPTEAVENAPTTSVQADVPREYESALSKATSYANTQNMSKQGVYDQLVSEYGEQFLATEAQYAIDNVQADWNANALAKAISYQETMSMSPAAIHDQLTSEYGEQFTQAQADYAIAHLN